MALNYRMAPDSEMVKKLHAAIDRCRETDHEEIINAAWDYYVNDEGHARWRCSNCGKICRKHPYEKRFCSKCGAHMTMNT